VSAAGAGDTNPTSARSIRFPFNPERRHHPPGKSETPIELALTICSEITGIETFATGNGIRDLRRLRKLYGGGRWRKRKGSRM